jgi:hypothetical protein
MLMMHDGMDRKPKYFEQAKESTFVVVAQTFCFRRRTILDWVCGHPGCIIHPVHPACIEI